MSGQHAEADTDSHQSTSKPGLVLWPLSVSALAYALGRGFRILANSTTCLPTVSS